MLQIENRQLKNKLYLSEIKNLLLKTFDEIENREDSWGVRQGHLYPADRDCHIKAGGKAECEPPHIFRLLTTNGPLAALATERPKNTLQVLTKTIAIDNDLGHPSSQVILNHT